MGIHPVILLKKTMKIDTRGKLLVILKKYKVNCYLYSALNE